MDSAFVAGVVELVYAAGPGPRRSSVSLQPDRAWRSGGGALVAGMAQQWSSLRVGHPAPKSVAWTAETTCDLHRCGAEPVLQNYCAAIVCSAIVHTMAARDH